ncbi:murein hydrolase activator EnvC family protein [Fusobacterium hwasookii]|uniref:Peptidase M23 n=1 Tax=Fusobacterium hwasookii ChDC F206 TaxID=1307443 RepID=A0AAC8WM01_9FUSO|nr:murein hydrolase activator EnvC [Fusobacterium hwasookii]ALQ36549.1 peptidase M23 [Fusobacterium hwasookii ChDC F206]ALQ36739.1 peptidase M23 [Fusobacterium hwasookii ChDC F300]QNE69459.1 murein hydrolase activator EnvC [Fusobacterium hwasookii]QYR56065.1 murein hydrolase activator EnvC [Fusobacterium hwasookii]
MSSKMMKTKIFLTFFLLSASIYPASNSVKDMNKRLKNIDKEIEKKNTRIKAIDTETSKLEKMIKELEEEIKKLEHERKEIEDEITVVKKNIDYSKKNLEISEVEHGRKESEFVAKIIAWDKYSKIHGKDIDEKVLLTKNYREMLHGDLQRMGYIEKVTGNIKEVKEKIEAEKRKLDRLEAELRENLRKSDVKKEEQKKLKEQLQVEKKGHQSSIEKLKKEKQRISREIERIIRENARRAAEKAAREKAAREAAKNKGKSTGKGKGSDGTKVTTTTVDMPKISNPEAYKRIGKTIKPLNGQVVVYFGQKKAGVVESNGIEIKGKLGNPVVASKAGTVIYADAFQGLGKVVMIDYGGGIIGVYGNLLAIKVNINSKVSSGQTIGVLGLSSDKEPNLYYELRANLRPIDPMPTF